MRIPKLHVINLTHEAHEQHSVLAFTSCPPSRAGAIVASIDCFRGATDKEQICLRHIQGLIHAFQEAFWAMSELVNMIKSGLISN